MTNDEIKALQEIKDWVDTLVEDYSSLSVTYETDSYRSENDLVATIHFDGADDVRIYFPLDDPKCYWEHNGDKVRLDEALVWRYIAFTLAWGIGR